MPTARMLVFASLLLAGAWPARAEVCRPPTDATSARADIDAANLAARDAALMKQGLTYLPRSIVARGAVSRRPAGNVTTIEVWVGCRDLTDADLLLATDGRGAVYRILQTRAATQVAWHVCGPPTCEPPCGQPPVKTMLWVALPAGAAYRGERSLAWATTSAFETHDQACGIDGAPRSPAAPATSTPPPGGPSAPRVAPPRSTEVTATVPASACRPGSRNELACLRRENAVLRQDAQRRADADRVREAEIERMRHKVTTKLKGVD